MQITVKRAGELIASPWKNGGGVTRELAVAPPRASLDNFVWRASVADVSASGPFSTFPGIDRVIVLLDGDGMVLAGADGTSHRLTTRFAPHVFPGETPIEATLTGGATRDFNLMVRRAHARGAVEIHRETTTLVVEDDTLAVLCHVLQGEWLLAGEAISPASRLGPGDTVRIEPDGAAPCAAAQLVPAAQAGDAPALLVAHVRACPR
ncbi:Protein Ves [Pandoraea terrae]|uniref:Protein Ves n=1 Tax=Pandoraea terrae TaxID=1537710 RepID=A0A5E4RUK4_9BURK|nr:HutD family protein [Pandoraea terrae]VVD65629.1 Protein Ves [Pandoraea terrae]